MNQIKDIIKKYKLCYRLDGLENEMKAKNIIRLETLQKAKLKIISVDKFRVDAIFLYKNKKSLLTWYNDYFIEMDLLNCIDDETFDIMIDEVMDICANYHFCKNFGG